MTQRMEKALVVYCSPSGSTQHVATGIETALAGSGVDVRSVDLGNEKEWAPIFDEMTASNNRTCLFVGSPVYAGHPIPPVMQFINRMPAAPGLYAAPFVTWGQVISGLALYDMAAALCEKNVKVVGAIKIVARHSMMWDSDDPLGKGRPNPDDDRMIAEFAQKS